jgi:hypothetical protein
MVTLLEPPRLRLHDGRRPFDYPAANVSQALGRPLLNPVFSQY